MRVTYWVLLFVLVASVSFGAVKAQEVAVEKDWKLAILKAAQSAVKDPDSVRVRMPEPKQDKSVICGWINAKNSFGGYVGEQIFIAMLFELKDQASDKKSYAAKMTMIGSEESSNKTIMHACTSDHGYSESELAVASIKIVSAE